MLLKRHGQSMTNQSSLSPFIMERRASWAMESMKLIALRNLGGLLSIKLILSELLFDVSFASARPKSCESWFMGCEKLEAIDGIENLNTSMVTDM